MSSGKHETDVLEGPQSKPTGFLARLEPKEWRRRLWHMSPGLLPPLLWLIPHRDPLSWIAKSIIAVIGIALSLHIFLRYQHIQRSGDTARATAVLGYVLSVFGAFLIFPQAAQIGMAVLGILAFGDGCATLGGQLFRGPRLPWNGDKSWSGFFSFIVMGTLVAALWYWGETWFNVEAAEYRQVSFLTALAVTGSAALVAAIAESLPSRLNDNIRVGFCAVLTMAAAQTVFVGWDHL
ncbi:diacylglycerol/polyprenol kinase family protein [Thalassoroseus pseudoceratinae]|uniref:hypothetical protein n=1 Tax=Thalassoroseus pseudoceratinae TaxID=2713176 RepID=UPI00141E5730|nr:hypothetical protein [Thalassoroseus pseudoceratinae]